MVNISSLLRAMDKFFLIQHKVRHFFLVCAFLQQSFLLQDVPALVRAPVDTQSMSPNTVRPTHLLLPCPAGFNHSMSRWSFYLPWDSLPSSKCFFRSNFLWLRDFFFQLKWTVLEQVCPSVFQLMTLKKSNKWSNPNYKNKVKNTRPLISCSEANCATLI